MARVSSLFWLNECWALIFEIYPTLQNLYNTTACVETRGTVSFWDSGNTVKMLSQGDINSTNHMPVNMEMSVTTYVNSEVRSVIRFCIALSQSALEIHSKICMAHSVCPFKWFANGCTIRNEGRADAVWWLTTLWRVVNICSLLVMEFWHPTANHLNGHTLWAIHFLCFGVGLGGGWGNWFNTIQKQIT